MIGRLSHRVIEFWLELLADTGIVKESRLKNLLAEAKELTAIFAASQRTARPAHGPMTQ